MRIAMNKPELYNASNEIQRQSTLQCLKDHAQHIKWNKIDTAIDVGCGDGSVSALVKNYSPDHTHRYKKYVACDINENMIQFAKERYSNEDISFRIMDIAGDIPKDLIGAFNHAFSFYALHWIKNQEKAFRNFYDLLTDDGDIFLVFIGSTPIYTVYKALEHHTKWKTWLKDVDVFVSPYHGLENPEKKVAEVANKCGFKNVEVKTKVISSHFDSIQGLKDIVQAVEPFNMSQEVFDDFFNDYVTAADRIGSINYHTNSNGEEKGVSYDYSLIILSANK